MTLVGFAVAGLGKKKKFFFFSPRKWVAGLFRGKAVIQAVWDAAGDEKKCVGDAALDEGANQAIFGVFA